MADLTSLASASVVDIVILILVRLLFTWLLIYMNCCLTDHSNFSDPEIYMHLCFIKSLVTVSSAPHTTLQCINYELCSVWQ